jgi:DNA-binding MarR family transcriptional regulator
VTRSVQAVLTHLAGQAGLNQSDFQALVRLVAADGMTGAELRRILGVTSSSITELADRLERDGMIARTRRRSDRRLVVFEPTSRGRDAVERALSPVLAAMGTVVGSLAEDDLVIVSRFLGEVEAALSELVTRWP